MGIRLLLRILFAKKNSQCKFCHFIGSEEGVGNHIFYEHRSNPEMKLLDDEFNRIEQLSEELDTKFDSFILRFK